MGCSRLQFKRGGAASEASFGIWQVAVIEFWQTLQYSSSFLFQNNAVNVRSLKIIMASH